MSITPSTAGTVPQAVGDSHSNRPTPTPEHFQSWEEVQAYLNTVTDYEKMVRYTMKRGEFDLGRVSRYFASLADPQSNYECIHIAGTKGKGSTAIMLDSLLRAHGVTAGLYTSPHLEHVSERIQLNGQPISEPELVAAFNEMLPPLSRFQRSGDELTWFEIMTAAALVAFRTAGVEAAVLETGLGGRLDATNAVMPAVTCITSIGHDHHDKLGPTLEDIAYEKAGIIKPGVPLVLGQVPKGPLEVILNKVRDLDVPVRRFRSDFDAQNIQPTADGISADLSGAGYRYRDVQLPVIGAVQAKNAAIAVEILHQYFSRTGTGEVREDAVRAGLGAARTPGRCELFAGAPDVVLDVAHNDESVRQTVKAVLQRYAGRRMVLLAAVSKDKELEAIISGFAELAPEMAVFTEFPSVRATPAGDLLAMWQKYRGTQIGRAHV